MTNDLHVLVIGGGIGGLCLAQGLKKAGIRVDVYERDLSSSSRLQGVRIHIDPDGSTALHECLPKSLWEIFDSTGGDFSRGFTMLNEKLEVLMNFHQPPAVDNLVARTPLGEPHEFASDFACRSGRCSPFRQAV